ncbi:uncharacterized protein LOC126787301 [Argentina anserina]|uniref:uncharacterized protein LOC126787301 n=1 Tax=Argentina anserina TaxID=57926 RepID=UPI00217668FE|nr:uncharacterized protein LOC126787301 [Potentilla anserina]
MYSLKVPFFHFLRVLITLLFCSSVTPFYMPRLGTFRRTIHHDSKTIPSSSVPGFRKFYFNQKLDHFNYKPESYTTFKQMYVINAKYWGGANSGSPILAYLGDEEALYYDYKNFLTDHAPRFKALLVYMEHRYYGESVPFGLSTTKALKNSSIRGYFNSAQALADYAAVLLHVKKTYSAKTSPIIVVGGSYGGMLASWFRLKYPHIAHGALASSAPILYFDNIIPPEKGYYSVVTKDFKESSEHCYQTIRNSWAEIDRVASKSNGLSILSKRFSTCKKVKRASNLKDYLDNNYAYAAQYDPAEVDSICRDIDAAPIKTDILDKIIAAFEPATPQKGSKPCHDIEVINLEGWGWQTCSEMVMPISHGNASDSMYPPEHFDLDSFSNQCKKLYGVLPQPHWITTYYGSHDLKSILHKFGSNIIFSNGLKDPWSCAGVLGDISDSLVAISTVNGSHCLDLSAADSTDPQWLVQQRHTEVKIIEGWIAKYHSDHQASNKLSPPS